MEIAASMCQTFFPQYFGFEFELHYIFVLQGFGGSQVGSLDMAGKDIQHLPVEFHLSNHFQIGHRDDCCQKFEHHEHFQAIVQQHVLSPDLDHKLLVHLLKSSPYSSAVRPPGQGIFICVQSIVPRTPGNLLILQNSNLVFLEAGPWGKLMYFIMKPRN